MMNARAALARATYAAVLRLATPLWLARLWWRGTREPLYRAHLAERLGFGPPPARPAALWVHAVSLGETRAAAPLVAAWRALQPGQPLLLTHGTATGREAGRALLHPGDTQAWLPLDTPGAVRRFLRRHRPKLGVLVETEVWPVLLHESRRAGVPMALVNARLSARSLAKGRRWSALLRPATASLSQVLAQTELDAQRLREMGADPVQVCGNLKFDLAVDEPRLAQGRRWREALARPVVLAAVTREGEEAALLRAWGPAREQSKEFPAGARPLLVIVPRHPQRFDEVASMVEQAGFTLARRTRLGSGPAPLGPTGPGLGVAPAEDEGGEAFTAAQRAADVWLGDSLGEMALYYGLADVALLGGSFEPLGGQNLIEAAACGCPLVMGPHTFNFAQAADDAQAAGAARRVPSMPLAVQEALRWLQEPGRAEDSRRAQAFAAAHRGAAVRMAAALVALSPAAGRA